MDLDEWELLPVDEFLDFDDDCGETTKKKTEFDPVTVIDIDFEYFRCPSPNRSFSPVPVRIHLDPPPMVIVEPPPEIDQETVSQVFFKKLDTEFVDMKILDAPPRSAAARAVPPPVESSPVFEDELSGGSPSEKSGLSLNSVLKWSFTGIGVVCSLGASEATVCVLIAGNRHRNKKLTFQIYTGDKRIKKVAQRAAKLNGAISAASGGGAALTGGHVGYCDSI